MTPKYPAYLATIIATALLQNLFFLPTLATAGTYKNSAHGNTGTGVSRASLNAVTSRNYATGNCAHCHEQHASIAASKPAPANGPDNYLAAGTEQDLCLHCHTAYTDNASSGVPADIDTDISNASNHRHNLTISNTAHKPKETLDDINNANKHIECTDCHNPHLARVNSPSPRTKGTNAITAPNPLEGVPGAAIDYGETPTNWLAPSQNSYTLQTATKEYEICFKCHSGANIDVTSWGDSTTGPDSWTDVGMEFSPGNMSGHPVVMALNDYPNSEEVVKWIDGVPYNYKGLWNETVHATNWDQLLPPWENAGNQTMYCSDCHAGTNAAGPHGSAARWMLAGPNTAWPYTDQGNNGQAVGNFWKISTDWSFTPDILVSEFNGKLPFCMNCHPNNRQGNTVHWTGNHSGKACVGCHIRIPHGGKVSRLIAAEDGGSYSNMPDRYTADGAGNNPNGDDEPYINIFNKKKNDSYLASDCYSTRTGCTYHNNSTLVGESW